MWCWRRMLRIPWTANHVSSTMCLQRILSYFEHITRRGNEIIEKSIVVGNVEGKRPRGRSLTRWSDQLRKTGTRTFYKANLLQYQWPRTEPDGLASYITTLLAIAVITILSHEGPTKERELSRYFG
ncbi:jg18851 [Pararge aegeria aegeria]|uniref:Jg18851 protein n=1 Tax=Pararge aegeria aegeria TaxID=348720 RepID=A0A8S4QJP0_9NEOP|nr:jg18851 [Pararge aegeria aegeria]